MRKITLVAVTFSTLIAHTASAQEERADNSAATPELYRQLMACRMISPAEERLTCFDRQAAALDQATSRKDIVIADKEAMQAARRGLFGFAAPIAKLMGFGGNQDEADEIKEIETTVTSVGRTANGWRLDFEDGSTWEQNDTRDFVLSPKVGNEARITRGALGTYLVSVRGQRSIKMRRVN
jgi:hypothetical protein